ncbi:purine-nucleoside phosphorylase [Clostridium rhizosphaerae]|uniref:purine-nucleoside phosphorylase n=1 Tax=Clostridium rhizosphaerae TaxID=2803861 RepID=UPI001FAEF0D1|nr:purine-nucleoside phosphorylase [Clostridium rhizosphaerae]
MYDKVAESAKYIRDIITNFNLKVAVILSSGLGNLVDVFESKEYINYKDIPNFPQSTVEGHEGRLVFGKIKGSDVLAMQWRFHYYEGYTMKEVTYPVYVMQQLDIEKLMVTNACGGIDTDFKPGTLMLIKDFINLFVDNPLIGVDDKRFGDKIS